LCVGSATRSADQVLKEARADACTVFVMNWKSKLLTLTAAAILIACAAALAGDQTNSAAPSCCTSHPTGEAQAIADLRRTLDPKQFTGQVREAYQVAQDNPDLLAQLHCYCGCDRTNGHKNLLDCYRDHHGASCAICTGEALEAKKLFDQGASIETIRAALRARFAGQN
jgi:hypothetical protein